MDLVVENHTAVDHVVTKMIITDQRLVPRQLHKFQVVSRYRAAAIFRGKCLHLGSAAD